MLNLSELTKAMVKKIKVIAFDFDGVFTNNKVLVDQDGKESVLCSRLDGLGLKKLRKLGLKLIIVSSEKNSVVSQRAIKLELECFQGVDDKVAVLKDFLLENQCSKKELLFVGNDENDIPALRFAGLSIGVADSHNSIRDYIDFTTHKSGGEGAVREICDKIFELLTL